MKSLSLGYYRQRINRKLHVKDAKKTFVFSNMGVQALKSLAGGKNIRRWWLLFLFSLRNQLKVKVLVVKAAKEMQVVVLNSKRLN